MKRISAKYSLTRDVLEYVLPKFDMIAEIRNKFYQSFCDVLKENVEIEQEEFYKKTNFQAEFFITSKKEFNDLTNILIDIKSDISEENFKKLKNILFNYEK